MISQTRTRAQVPAITSDRWHVVHAHWSEVSGRKPYERSIVSEHDDRVAAVKAARVLILSLNKKAGSVSPDHQDQVFVRQPNFKSLVHSVRRGRRRHG